MSEQRECSECHALVTVTTDARGWLVGQCECGTRHYVWTGEPRTADTVGQLALELS